jgi:quinol monooxygenase YgiN
MSESVKTVAVLVANSGKKEDLKALLKGMVAPSRAEPGNSGYELWQDQTNDNRFVLDEVYVNEAAVAEHRETPHYKDYASKISDLAERMVFRLKDVV